MLVTSSQATEIWEESARGRAWKCGLFSPPHISFWEEGICDRVTWCLGPFSLVITHISLSSLFLSSSVRISVFPPLLLAQPELGRSTLPACRHPLYYFRTSQREAQPPD